MSIEIIKADFANPKHAEDIGYLLDVYARDPMGGGTPLDEDIKNRLALELAKRSFAFSVLAYSDGKPAGLANCFEGFSTFKCKPLVNIHDIVVHPDFRGQGVAQNIMEHIETIARDIGACKITLEVLEGNQAAQAAYTKFGFEGYELDPEKGKALFWEKPL